MTRTRRWTTTAIACSLSLTLLPLHAAESRQVRRTQSLSGTWQIAEGAMDRLPTVFGSTVPVPGLVDMASPAFENVAPKVADREKLPSKDPHRDAFWYRRTFTVTAPLPARSTLKVSKAMFGSRAILNGTVLGDHAPSFTPGYFDARKALRAGENELIIRVGADREAVTTAVPSGFDFEKERYIPGIFDEVELILSGTPHILTVQTIPDITKQTVRVQTRIRNTGAATKASLSFVVREAKSGKIVGSAKAEAGTLKTSTEKNLDAYIRINGCRLWSPEDPFLYSLTVETGTDSVETRFGMREFRFDPATRMAKLNGKPYMMRGSNITLYRFFEDPNRGALPWDEKWVREIHRKAKDMHWNCLRYCIGFPPEAWYRIADEEGILIQDEFPIWFGGPGWCVWPAALKREQLAVEFAEWMRERWNHPSVVIWDASNETSTSETGPAVKKVRALDLSNRPWDNGYIPPEKPGDAFEAHPYHFMNSNFKLRQLEQAGTEPWGSAIPNSKNNAVIINEYGWLWLNRDGSPTTLTKDLYRKLLGPDSTAEQRLKLYGQYLAAETEFWRVNRKVAALMHFTMLGYSRPAGQTSDHWLDVVNLTWEPNFYRYVRDSFAPVCLSIKFWKERLPAGSAVRIPVAVINDLDVGWSGPITLSVKQGDRVVSRTQQDSRVAAYAVGDVTFDFAMPKKGGTYTLEAKLQGSDRQPVHSVRKFKLDAPVDLTSGKTAGARLVDIKGMPDVTVTSPNDPTRPVPGGVHWFGRDHQRNLQKTREKNFDLCLLGDSITQGWPGDLFNKNFGKYRPANFGIGGDRAENVLWRLNHGELAGTSPKVILLLLGTNNSGMNTSGEIALGVATVIQKLRTMLPKTRILLMAIFPSQATKNRRRIEGANIHLARMDDGNMVRYIDVNKNFLDENGKLRQDMFRDDVHLSRLGYAMWGATTRETVAELMKE